MDKPKEKCGQLGSIQRLEDLQDQLCAEGTLIEMNGLFKLTKTEEGWVDALAVRDRALETSVEHWIAERSSLAGILDRYQKYDPSLHTREMPRHYPLRILSGVGSISSGKNIFMFFPYALGLEARGEEDVFGVEFIDVWSNLFRRSVFECAKRVFNPLDLLKLLIPLEVNLDRTIFLSSIFHEIGHRVGPYRVSPGTLPGMHLSTFQTDMFGELATDSLLILNLPEFPEVALFVILQRLFWFGRRGYADDPRSGMINTDNDAWIGAYLWNQLGRHGVLSMAGQGGSLRFHPERVEECFRGILTEIDSLARQTKDAPQQQELVWRWLSNQVPCDRNRFFLPVELQKVFGRCHDIPEVPHFQPILPYSQLSQLKDVSA